MNGCKSYEKIILLIHGMGSNKAMDFYRNHYMKSTISLEWIFPGMANQFHLTVISQSRDVLKS
jgi:hypothetical protein